MKFKYIVPWEMDIFDMVIEYGDEEDYEASEEYKAGKMEDNETKTN